MAQKRIHNPQTGKYYQIRQKNTNAGQKGQIMGLFKIKKAGSEFGNALKKLSKE